MSQVEVVDRDYSNVEAAENDKRKKASSKVKLTEISKKAIDAVYAVARKKEKKLEKVQNQIEEKEKEQMEEISYVKYFFNEIKLKGLKRKKAKLEKKVQKEKLRALRITESMKKGMLFKYVSRFDNEKELNVEEVSRDAIAEEINKEFEQMKNNIKNTEEKASNNTVDKNVFTSDMKEKEMNEKEKMYAKQQEKNENDLPEQKTDVEDISMNKPRNRFIDETDDAYENYLSDFYSSTYSMGKTDIIQDEIVMSKANEPELDAFFASLRNATPEFSEDLVSSEEEKTEEVSMVEEPDFSEKVEEPSPIVETSEDIVDEIGSDEVSLDDEKIVAAINNMINDSNSVEDMKQVKQLIANLNAAKDNSEKDEKESEEASKQRIEKEEIEEARTLEFEKNKKLLIDETDAYIENSRRAKARIQKEKEDIEKIERNIQSIDAMNAMILESIGPRAVNVTVDENTRGGK